LTRDRVLATAIDINLDELLANMQTASATEAMHWNTSDAASRNQVAGVVSAELSKTRAARLKIDISAMNSVHNDEMNVVLESGAVFANDHACSV
jgi:hypothetical protein